MTTSSMLSLNDTFPQLANDHLVLPKKSPTILPILHYLPISSATDVLLLSEDRDSVLVFPAEARGRLLGKSSKMERIWVKEGGRHFVRDELVESCHYAPLEHPFRLLRSSRCLQVDSAYNHSLMSDLPRSSHDHRFLDEGNVIYVTSVLSHNSEQIFLQILTQYAEGRIIKKIPFIKLERMHPMGIVLCPETKCLWIIVAGSFTHQIRLFKSNSIYDDNVAFQEKQVEPFRNKKSCDPSHTLRKDGGFSFLIDQGMLYLLCNHQRLFYIPTREFIIQREILGDGEILEVEIYNIHRFKLLTACTHLKHSQLKYSHTLMHRGKLYMVSGSEITKKETKENSTIFVWDLRRRTFSTLDTLLPRGFRITSIVGAGNSLYFTGTGSTKRISVYAMVEVMLRKETMPFSDGDAFCDVIVSCAEGPQVDRVPLLLVKEDANPVRYAEINQFLAHPVEDATKFIREYAFRHNHRMPQVVGDGYHLLAGNVDPSMRNVISSYRVVDQEKGRQEQQKKSPKPDRKSRKSKKLSQQQYLEEVKDSELELISPMVGEDLLEIFVALGDPDVEFL